MPALPAAQPRLRPAGRPRWSSLIPSDGSIGPVEKTVRALHSEIGGGIAVAAPLEGVTGRASGPPRFSDRVRVPIIAVCLSPRDFPPTSLAMPDTFDPYREALIMETETIWPDEFADVAPATKVEVSEKLHAEPDKCAQLEYVRVHTGFCRRITVTSADLERLGVA